MADAQGIWIPIGPRGGGTPSISNVFTFDANTDALEFVFQAREAATITRLGVLWGTASGGTGFTPNYKISLQGIGTTGNPDGTIKGGGSPASKVFSPVPLGWSDNTWHWLTLDNSYACSRGEFLSVVVAYDSDNGGHGPGTDGSSATFIQHQAYAALLGFPYTILNNAGSRSKATGFPPSFGYASASKTYGFPGQSVYAGSIAAASEVGVKFTLSSSWGSTFKVAGARPQALTNAAQSITMRLYNGGGASDTTVLQDATFDTDFSQIAAFGRFREWLFDEATLSTLKFGNTYRLSFISTGGTQTLQGIAVAAVGDNDAFPLGQNACGTFRNAGDWTDTTTDRPICDLLIDDITGTGSAFVF